MAPESTQYTLVGFSAELDWRPLHFRKPLPPNRVCGACGLVRPKTALLPCSHTLCESCYVQCAEEGPHVCPLDGCECQDEDIDWREFRAEELLRREVACWNKDNGCETTTAASQIFRHFHHECGHHSASCPKCSAKVLCSDVWSHLRSKCFPPVQPLGYEEEGPSSSEQDAALLDFKRAFENQAAEMRAFLERLVIAIGTHEDRFNEISEGINTFKETLKEVAAQTLQNEVTLSGSIFEIAASNKKLLKCFAMEPTKIINLPESITTLEKALRDELANATSGTNDHLTQIASVIRGEAKEHARSSIEKIREFLGHPKLQVALSIFVVKGVKLLQENALKGSRAVYESERVYLRGYCISPGVNFKKEGESVKLYAWIRVNKGDMDEFLEWTLMHNVRLSVLHPKESSKRAIEVKVYGKNFKKPSQSHNKECYLPDNALDIKDLFDEGYVENDNLLVKWELLPSVTDESEEPEM